MSEAAFSLLAPPIQHVLWDMHWDALRPIQIDAIMELLQGDRHIIIAARTAAGKTEAAFLPILSRVFENTRPSIQALYVGPLKALINDQFQRLEDLCQRTQIPVHRWHGDVGATKKQKLIKNPSGVLLITPESIESLFVNRSTALPYLFKYLSFVVIDELHALVGSERGTHLRSLLCRLRRHVDNEFRVVALSATLGHWFRKYAEWMCPDNPDQVRVISDAGEQKQTLFKIHAYVSHARLKGEDESDESTALPPGIVEEMYGHLVGRKNLVFANSRQDVELFADALKRRCQELGRPNEFLVHHGSLSKEMREFTEQEMQGQRPQTTVCSSSLELGIDIGNVAAVGQVDPPWSVSSLVQRLGRSGRGEGEPQCMRVYVSEQKANERTSLQKRLYPRLLRTVAITELMLEKPTWVEPPDIDVLDFSTLTQQVLSVLAETGGLSASGVSERLIVDGAFRAVDQSLFTDLLRSLAKHKLIEQMARGDLILAPDGEAIVNHYLFYSAFASPVEYSVRYGSQPIGRLPALCVPRPNDHFILGGRRWRVIEVDHDHREILVQRARGRKPPMFLGGGGEIHPMVRQKMRDVLLGQNHYSYLNQTAADVLEEARATAHQIGLATTPLVTLSGRHCLWFTWTGTKIQRTLCLLADCVGLTAIDRDIAVEFETGMQDVLERLEKALATDLDDIAIAQRIPAKQTRKYDDYISEDLLAVGLARDAIDTSGARNEITRLLCAE